MLPHFKACFVPLGVLLPLGQIGSGLVAAVQLQQGFQAVGIGLRVGNLAVVFQTVGIADALLLPPLPEPARAHALRGGLGHGFRRQFRQPCFGRLCQRAAVRYGAEMDAAACFGQTHQHRGIAVAQFEIADVRLPAGSLHQDFSALRFGKFGRGLAAGLCFRRPLRHFVQIGGRRQADRAALGNLHLYHFVGCVEPFGYAPVDGLGVNPVKLAAVGGTDFGVGQRQPPQDGLFGKADDLRQVVGNTGVLRQQVVVQRFAVAAQFFVGGGMVKDVLPEVAQYFQHFAMLAGGDVGIEHQRTGAAAERIHFQADIESGADDSAVDDIGGEIVQQPLIRLFGIGFGFLFFETEHQRKFVFGIVCVLHHADMPAVFQPRLVFVRTPHAQRNRPHVAERPFYQRGRAVDIQIAHQHQNGIVAAVPFVVERAGGIRAGALHRLQPAYWRIASLPRSFVH